MDGDSADQMVDPLELRREPSTAEPKALQKVDGTVGGKAVSMGYWMVEQTDGQRAPLLVEKLVGMKGDRKDRMTVDVSGDWLVALSVGSLEAVMAVAKAELLAASTADWLVVQ